MVLRSTIRYCGNPKAFVFDITSDDISQLNDIDLRELVGRLCEAELIDHRLSPAAVTWGGNQTAAVLREIPSALQILESPGVQHVSPPQPQ